MHKRILILRLSSLGDLILSTSVLEVASLTQNASIDWVVASEFKGLLEGHPKIQKLWKFDRKSGSESWVRFCRELWDQQYDEIYDLHRSLRTFLMRLLFFYWGLKARSFSTRRIQKWKAISKERLFLFIYFIFKGALPKSLRPNPWVIRFTKTVGGSGKERPNLRHLVQDGPNAEVPGLPKELASGGTPYFCVMPSSRWKGKNWPVKSYATLLKKLQITQALTPVILGLGSDSESVELVSLLRAEGVRFVSGVGLWNFKQTAQVLANSAGYLGGDTGMAHLSEAIGKPATLIFGPTTPDMGFGPWRPQSQSIGRDLWCRPCSKDGTGCFRFRNKWMCLQGLSPDEVLNQLDKSKQDQSWQEGGICEKSS